MKANYSTYITRAVILLLIFFFLSMALFAQQNPLQKEDVKKEDAFPKVSQLVIEKIESYMICAFK